jgi:intracellular sulfur oxidation DsrE/DsrF family protein
MKHINILAVPLAFLICFLSPNALAADSSTAKGKVVMQVSDADTGKWNLVLNNAKNIQQSYGAEKVDIEIVTFGPGIAMLRSNSVSAKQIEEAQYMGINIVACQNTMKAMKLTQNDMLSTVGYVPSGVVEIMKKEKEGYAYIRP